MVHLKIKEVSGLDRELPFKLHSHPESLSFTAILIDEEGNVGECGVVNEEKDKNADDGLFYKERSFAKSLSGAIRRGNECFVYNNVPYWITSSDADEFVASENEKLKAQEAHRKEEKEKCIRYLKEERGVKYLIHFTPLINLKGISRYGICPRKELPPDVVPTVTDSARFDNRLDCCSYSVSFPSYQQLYVKRNQSKTHFAICIIDVDALDDFGFWDIFYYGDNAARGYTDLLFNVAEHHSMEACKLMFNEYAYNSNLVKIERPDCIPDSYTTHPQAEIMIRGIVETKHIIEINVIDIYDYHLACNYLSDELKNKLRVDKSLFDKRPDYAKWSKY